MTSFRWSKRGKRGHSGRKQAAPRERVPPTSLRSVDNLFVGICNRSLIHGFSLGHVRGRHSSPSRLPFWPKWGSTVTQVLKMHTIDAFHVKKTFPPGIFPLIPFQQAFPRGNKPSDQFCTSPWQGYTPKGPLLPPLKGQRQLMPAGVEKSISHAFPQVPTWFFFFRSPFQRFLSRYRSSPGGVIALPVEISPFHPKSYGPFSHTGITRVLPY